MSAEKLFDPKNDRLARDIRNQLARAFVRQLEANLDLRPVDALAARFLAEKPGAPYEGYINDHLTLFRAAKNIIDSRQIKENFYRALVLWDQGLFFETHEVLEPLWKDATGSEKLILQALIRAAGVYIHMGTDNLAGATKMAARAVETLTRYHDLVPPFPGLDRLIDSLKILDPHPPQILRESGEKK